MATRVGLVITLTSLILLLAIPSVNAGGGKGICVLDRVDTSWAYTIRRICIDGYEFVAMSGVGYRFDLEQVFIRTAPKGNSIPKKCECPK